MQQEITEEDLEVAEAGVAFAMANCPVEGVVSTPDGTPVTLDMLQALQERLKEIEGDPAKVSEFSGEQILQLGALMEYTNENCPVDSTMTFHDGRRILGRDISALTEKIKELMLESAVVS